MAKRAKTRRRPASKPLSKRSTTPLAVDRVNVNRLTQLTNNGLRTPERVALPVTSEEGRKTQILRSFFQGIDFDALEADLEQMNELQMIVNRRGDDDASAAVGRVIELLEALQDTGETCGFNPGK